MTHPVAPRTARITRCVVLLALAAAAVWGALQLEFLCDDAFITFRYVSNAHDGLGLVWNPPPFRPVEGYTGFLWALLLWATWSWFSIEPPQSANVLSMLCGLLLLAVTAVAAFRLRDRHGRSLPDLVAFCVLAAVVGNRTFLTWMTGGLETALFNVAFVAWVLLAFRSRQQRTRRWLLTWALAAAVAALTRPDGLLLVAATIAAAALSLVRREQRARDLASGLLPLLAVVGHVLWRRGFYGEWLPNTYFAKVTSPWPEAGIRYLLGFGLEHGAWLWIALLLPWLLCEGMRQRSAWRQLVDHVPAVAAVSAIVFQVGYYVLRVGGDPFEYRILSHLVPLGALATAAMAARMRAGAGLPVLSLLALALASSFGWLHLALTDARMSVYYTPIAAKAPRWVQPLARWHDRNQAWLQAHVICGRRHLHALFVLEARAALPERTRMQVDADDLPVLVVDGAGLTGWTLPDCVVIDRLGLNDWVAARTPVARQESPLVPKPILTAAMAAADANGDTRCSRAELQAAFGAASGQGPEHAAELVGLLLMLFADERSDSLTASEALQVEPFLTNLRFMAHERNAPAGYLAAFDANVAIENRRVVVRQRSKPLTADAVRSIEAEWRGRVQRGQVGR